MSNNTKGERIANSYERMECMAPELRQCVHEYGYAIVATCTKLGIRKPSVIHELVREIWEGARQPRQRRARAGTLDWILLQAGAQVTAAELARILRNNNLVIVPMHPTSEMIAASLAEVSGFNQRVTKTEKHSLRLRAALRAGLKYMDRQASVDEKDDRAA